MRGRRSLRMASGPAPQPRSASSASAAADITSSGAGVAVHSSKESAACCRSRPSPPNAGGAGRARLGEQRRRGRVVEEVHDEGLGPQGRQREHVARDADGGRVHDEIRPHAGGVLERQYAEIAGQVGERVPQIEGPRRFPHGDGHGSGAGPHDGQGRGARRALRPRTRGPSARPGRTPRPCAGIGRSRRRPCCARAACRPRSRACSPPPAGWHPRTDGRRAPRPRSCAAS